MQNELANMVTTLTFLKKRLTCFKDKFKKIIESLYLAEEQDVMCILQDINFTIWQKRRLLDASY